MKGELVIYPHATSYNLFHFTKVPGGWCGILNSLEMAELNALRNCAFAQFTPGRTDPIRSPNN